MARAIYLLIGGIGVWLEDMHSEAGSIPPPCGPHFALVRAPCSMLNSSEVPIMHHPERLGQHHTGSTNKHSSKFDKAPIVSPWQYA